MATVIYTVFALPDKLPLKSLKQSAVQTRCNLENVGFDFLGGFLHICTAK
jgi:hypothetical protein